MAGNVELLKPIPYWLEITDVVEIHDEQLTEFGGLAGIKDIGLVESALANPKNRYGYEDVTDILALGISLCMAIARNHGFVDGNKRTGTAAMLEFLFINGYYLNVPDHYAEYPFLGGWVEDTLLNHISEDGFYERLYPFIQHSEGVSIDDIAPVDGRS